MNEHFLEPYQSDLPNDLNASNTFKSPTKYNCSESPTPCGKDDESNFLDARKRNFGDTSAINASLSDGLYTYTRSPKNLANLYIGSSKSKRSTPNKENLYNHVMITKSPKRINQLLFDSSIAYAKKGGDKSSLSPSLLPDTYRDISRQTEDVSSPVFSINQFNILAKLNLLTTLKDGGIKSKIPTARSERTETPRALLLGNTEINEKTENYGKYNPNKGEILLEDTISPETQELKQNEQEEEEVYEEDEDDEDEDDLMQQHLNQKENSRQNQQKFKVDLKLIKNDDDENNKKVFLCGENIQESIIINEQEQIDLIRKELPHQDVGHLPNYFSDAISQSESILIPLPKALENIDNPMVNERKEHIDILSMLKDPCEDIIKKLKNTQRNYEDDLFLPNIASLINNTQNAKNMKWIEYVDWKRIAQIYHKSNNNINIHDIIDPLLIKPGIFQNYYLLTAFTALAEIPYYVFRLFGEQSFNKQGCYSIRTCRDGIWKIHVIDDFVPVLKNQQLNPAFIGVNPVEQSLSIWPILLEKAWAKTFGNYESIQQGDVGDTLNELTGAPSFEISTIDPGFWDILENSYRSEYILIAKKVFNNSIEERIPPGLDLNYGFTIIGICMVNSLGEQEKLIRIRKNWTNAIWEGEWGYNSPKWTLEIKKGLEEYEIYYDDPNSIWISLKEFQELFSHLIINKINETYTNSHITLRQNKNAHSIIEFSINKRTNGWLQTIQLDKQLFRNGNGYEYSTNRLILFKKENNVYKYIKAIISTKVKSNNLQVDLSPGQYFALIIFDWQDKFYDFNVGFYGDSQLQFNRLRIKDYPQLYTELWNSLLIEKGNKENIKNKPEYTCYSLNLNEIKACLQLITNNSKNGILSDRKTIKNMQNLKYNYYIPNHPSSNLDHETIEFSIEPGNKQIIFYYLKDLEANMKIDCLDMQNLPF